MVVLLAQTAEAVQAKLEQSAGDVWRMVSFTAIPFLCGVIGLLLLYIKKDNEGDKLEAQAREKRLNDMVDRLKEGRS